MDSSSSPLNVLIKLLAIVFIAEAGVMLVLPAILPVMVIAVLIRALDLVRIFDVIWALTRGGPGTMTETISIYAYQMAFREFEISYSAAIGFLVIVMLTVIVVFALRRVEVGR